MKKGFIIFALLLLASSCLSALEGKIVDIKGKVELSTDGTTWRPAQKNDTLTPGTIISTSFKSEAVVSIGESVISVKPLSRMTIEMLYEKDGNTASSVYLSVGKVHAKAKASENKKVGFTVKSPSATASVRGTEGTVSANGVVHGITGIWCVSAPEDLNVQSGAPDSYNFNYPSDMGTVYVRQGEDGAGHMGGAIDRPDVKAAEQGRIEGFGEKNDNDSVQSSKGSIVVTVQIAAY